jgi:Spy/CpxP family protein refolding chaperone
MENAQMKVRTTPMFMVIGIAIAILLAESIAVAESVDTVTGASPVTTFDGSAIWQYGSGSSEGAMSWADELGLTGQQRTDFQIILADYAPRLRDLAKLGQDTANNLLAISPDTPEYADQTQEASAIAASSVAEVVVLLAEMRGKLYAVLTSAQRVQLQELLESHRERKISHNADEESTAEP